MSTANTKFQVTRLPQLTPTKIFERLQVVLQLLGDVSAYIENVDQDGRVNLKTFSHQPGCSTLPKATLLNTSVPQDRFENARWAITQLSQALEQEQKIPVVYGEVVGACVFPDGTVDHARTAAVVSEPKSDVEPLSGSLERLDIQQIKCLIARALRSVGDFSAYVLVADTDSSVNFKTFSPKLTCAMLPPPTGLWEAVDKNKLGVAVDVITRFNISRLDGKEFKRGQVEAECLPDGQ